MRKPTILVLSSSVSLLWGQNLGATIKVKNCAWPHTSLKSPIMRNIFLTSTPSYCLRVNWHCNLQSRHDLSNGMVILFFLLPRSQSSMSSLFMFRKLSSIATDKSEVIIWIGTWMCQINQSKEVVTQSNWTSISKTFREKIPVPKGSREIFPCSFVAFQMKGKKKRVETHFDKHLAS